AYLVSRVREQVAVPVAVHCHNDLGLAVANTLAAVGAGASQVQVTVNGIGERTGNASLAETVFGLELGYGVKTGVRMDATLIETSRMVETLTGIPVAPNAPVVGINVHTHEAGIHAAGVRRGAHTFEAFSPEALGQETEIAIGKHSGVHAVEEALGRMGILTSREQAAEITSRVKEVAAGRKKPIIPEYDLAAIASGVLGQPMQRQPVKIKGFSVSSGMGKAPVAKIVLEVNGLARAAEAEGVGSVDAAFKAVIAAIGRPVQLTDYRLQGVRGGTEALADARITIKDEAGREFRGNAVHEDVVRASLYAGVNAINRMMVAEANGEKSVNAGSGAAKDFAHLAADAKKGGERRREPGRLKN
ncbi:MAG: alpha-isopropylmalate synthase regulatory domain-containing protein, partial [Candidatus ainarchaeum sp.]|nr:alpha-isopropylmalate synthase regulatory domain-containing protein [Candidatus ainarchaeum sp.]